MMQKKDRMGSAKISCNENSEGDETLWLYDHATGLVTNKVYADGSRVVYTHAADGKPLRTTLTRGVWKENAYDALGQLTTVTYGGKVPKVSLARNAFGTVTNVSCASGLVYGFAVNDRQIVTNETVVSGASTNTLTRLLDAFDRPAGLLLDSGYALFYGRDSEHRITAVSNATFTAHYAYANGYVTGHTLTLSNGNTLARVMARDPHRPGLLTGITNLFNGVSVSSLAYDYDIAGRVTNRNDDAFGYNARSEVIGAAIGTNDYGYAYDAIGNRVFSAVNAVTNTYTANCLNQYTAAGSVSPVYDADGNMRWDGRMWHTWDAENRLVHSEPGWVGSTNGAVRVVNSYDHRHRRIQKRVEVLTGRGAGYPFDPSQAGTWNTVKTHTFVYDGWNLVLETVAHADGSVDRIEYVWGLDLSGTLQGAGGVGGLLFEVRNGQIFIPCYDANGNVTEYVDAAGNIRAHYEYSPFGEIVVQSGDLADTFKFRFSTKYWDAETRSYYYGYRHYAPKLGCWLNRDPIGKRGGLNLYCFCGNSPVVFVDGLGMMKGRFGPPKQAPEIISHFSHSVFGRLNASLVENSCKCACKKGKYTLSCTLSVVYQISLANENSPVWSGTAPSSYPSFPTPPDWSKWDYAKKRERTLAHERKHLAAFREWYNGRRSRIEVFEQLVYPSKDNCQMRRKVLVRENEDGWKKKFMEESNHVNW